MANRYLPLELIWEEIVLYEVVFVVYGVLMFAGFTTGITCHTYGTLTGPFLRIYDILSIMHIFDFLHGKESHFPLAW